MAILQGFFQTIGFPQEFSQKCGDLAPRGIGRRHIECNNRQAEKKYPGQNKVSDGKNRQDENPTVDRLKQPGLNGLEKAEE
jgi:hypothetical protein